MSSATSTVNSQVAQQLAERFLEFIRASPTPFHAVDWISKRLSSLGFQRLSESSAHWEIQNKGKYFFTRNYSSILAFTVGGKYQAGNGLNIIGAHTDSPVLKLKPISKLVGPLNMLQLGVEPYGGGLWHTWFDRDLSLAGRVFLTKKKDDSSVQLTQRLVNIRRPILRIPTLAIHLDRSVKEGFKFNDQTHLAPVLATAVKTKLSHDSGKNSPHHSALLELLASEGLGGLDKDEQISNFELCLYDTQESALGGLNNEFIFSARLDNLLSSWAAIESLVQSLENNNFIENESRVSVVACFDNEEVGSQSERGAASTLVEHFARRLSSSYLSNQSSDSSARTHQNNSSIFEASLRRSFFVSADMAHACHPNYSEKHEPQHRPSIHGGIVIKENANQRYATSGPTEAVIRAVAQLGGIPLQDFVIRNDSLCGSTIGPIVSAYGLRTVDVGVPQLSMHSIREMCGVDDLFHYVSFFNAFFRHVTTVDEGLSIDS